LPDLLKRLWREVRDLRSGASDAAADFGGCSARIRALCGEIDCHTGPAELETETTRAGSVGVVDLPTLERAKD
jgi:hypothetical protein